MASIFSSGQPPKSKIFANTYNRRLSSLFGYQAVDKKHAQTEIERNLGLRFVKVDMANDAFRVKSAALGNIFRSTPLSTPLQNYLERWMTETNLSYSDIAERQIRLNELRFMVCNDPIASRCCTLVAQEATQLDDQNRLISVESPSIAFVNKCYELFAQWGITQQRSYSVCFDLQQYGEALWAHRITEQGVERIIPLKVSQLRERLEFSPVHMAEYVAQMTGDLEANKNRQTKLGKLVHMLTKENDKVNDINENFADMFDTKLLGFEFHDGLIVPPWVVTHFRYNSDNSEFFPYGYPPMLMALAPFKQCHSTIALQGLARSMSFPIQLYKVKNTEGISPYQAFDTTNTVREEFDNIGVGPGSNSLEVYTINTKIWVPEGLVDLQVLKSEADIDFTGDLEMYQDRMFIATGVPKGYLSQEFGGYGQSGIALMEQYKPFASHVYTIQSSYLEGLGQLIRLHFAITGEFDYNTPFVLSMRFPAEDMGQEKREARAASMELANGIIELLQGVLGIEEGEPLPEDVVSDILSKYTFLDPTDLQRWLRLSAITKAASQSASEGDEDDGSDGGGDVDFGTEEGADMAGDMAGGEDDAGAGEAVEESLTTEERQYYLQTRAMLRERINQEDKRKLQERRRKRLKEISERYKNSKNDIYFQFLRENHMTEFRIPGATHNVMVPLITKSDPLYEAIEVLTTDIDGGGRRRLTETITVKDMMDNVKGDNIDINFDQPLREHIDDYSPDSGPLVQSYIDDDPTSST